MYSRIFPPPPNGPAALFPDLSHYFAYLTHGQPVLIRERFIDLPITPKARIRLVNLKATPYLGIAPAIEVVAEVQYRTESALLRNILQDLHYKVQWEYLPRIVVICHLVPPPQ
jgi:hypothetical protein